jgi:hypothetical protein
LPFLRANLSLSLAPLVATPQLARSLFFSASMPKEQVTSYQRAFKTTPTWASWTWLPSIW